MTSNPSNSAMLVDETDLSLEGFQFDPQIGTSPRDRLRDIADTLIRRPLYKLIYGKSFPICPTPLT